MIQLERLKCLGGG